MAAHHGRDGATVWLMAEDRASNAACAWSIVGSCRGARLILHVGTWMQGV